MSPSAIQERIHTFPRWHYQFDLDGQLTPIFELEHINRHRQRKKHFFNPLVDLCGNTLRGRRVLDLGCNAGFWSLAAIEAGCDFVFGVDGRQMHIDQANFVFEVKGIQHERYQFVCGNVFSQLYPGLFDLVLCLGLLYHVNRPIELMQRIAAVNSDLLIIDTRLQPGEKAAFFVQHENVDEPRMSVDYGLVLVPTRQAVIELVKLFGYHGVVLKPDFDDWTGAWDFQEGLRRAFICARYTELSALHPSAELVF